MGLHCSRAGFCYESYELILKANKKFHSKQIMRARALYDECRWLYIQNIVSIVKV